MRTIWVGRLDRDDEYYSDDYFFYEKESARYAIGNIRGEDAPQVLGFELTPGERVEVRVERVGANEEA